MPRPWRPSEPGSTACGSMTTWPVRSKGRPTSWSVGLPCPRWPRPCRGSPLGPLVLNVANRDPGVLAVMAATLQQVSGGRLFLGLGAGVERAHPTRSSRRRSDVRWQRPGAASSLVERTITMLQSGLVGRCASGRGISPTRLRSPRSWLRPSGRRWPSSPVESETVSACRWDQRPRTWWPWPVVPAPVRAAIPRFPGGCDPALWLTRAEPPRGAAD